MSCGPKGLVLQEGGAGVWTGRTVPTQPHTLVSLSASPLVCHESRWLACRAVSASALPVPTATTRCQLPSSLSRPLSLPHSPPSYRVLPPRNQFS